VHARDSAPRCICNCLADPAFAYIDKMRLKWGCPRNIARRPRAKFYDIQRCVFSSFPWKLPRVINEKKKKKNRRKESQCALDRTQTTKEDVKFWLFSGQNCSFKTYAICIAIFRSGSRVAIDRFMERSSEM